MKLVNEIEMLRKPEIDFSEWISDSFFSGILDSNSQYSGFHKQILESRLPYMEQDEN